MNIDGKQNFVALYARVSSERQAEEKTIESQLAALREHAAKQGYTVSEEHIFTDNGISGTELIRPGLEALRDLVATQAINRIVVLCPDRLSRKQAHQLILSEEFSRYDVDLEFVNYTASSSPEDQLFLQMQGAIAEYEREKIMERSRRGKIYKARGQKVCVLSNAPYGFIYRKRSDSSDAAYEVHPEESKIVRKVFQMHGVERLSIGAIVRYLNEAEILAPGGGKHWHRSGVYRILKNPAYVGKAAYKKTQVIPRRNAQSSTVVRGLKARYPKSSKTRLDLPKDDWISISVPRLVPESLFDRVNEQLTENKRFSPRNSKRHDYLLTGLLQCEECGYSLQGITTKSRGKERSYYKCSGKSNWRLPNETRCSSHYISSKILDDLTWEQTKQLIEQPELVLAEYANRTQEKGKVHVSIKALITAKKKELRAIEIEKSRLMDLYQAGAVTLEEIKPRLTDIQRRVDDTQKEHATLLLSEQQEHQQLQLIEHFDVFQKKLTNNLAEISFADRKKIIQMLVCQVIVNCSKAEITVKHVVPMAPDVYRLCPDRVVACFVDPLA